MTTLLPVIQNSGRSSCGLEMPNQTGRVAENNGRLHPPNWVVPKLEIHAGT